MDLLGEDFSGLQVKILKFPATIGNKNVIIVHYYRRILYVVPVSFCGVTAGGITK